MQVLRLGVYAAVLGMDWLKLHSPMTCDWEANSMQFLQAGVPVTLHGIRSVTLATLQAISVEQVNNALVGNDIWAMVAIAQETPDSPVHISPLEPDMEQLLTEYVDVFAEPKTLTPHRLYDQALTLEPVHHPPNSPPYRYSPQQKDEIEHQLAEMIVAGIVSHSMSPYASPVLLVKQGGSWRLRRLQETEWSNN